MASEAPYSKLHRMVVYFPNSWLVVIAVILAIVAMVLYVLMKNRHLSLRGLLKTIYIIISEVFWQHDEVRYGFAVFSISMSTFGLYCLITSTLCELFQISLIGGMAVLIGCVIMYGNFSLNRYAELSDVVVDKHIASHGARNYDPQPKDY